jgi:hypothetical protein
MVIGNSTAYNASINGQFEEMETFNYQLAPGDIAANFQMVADVDSDLNGIPDILEDIHLTKARPFLGAPVVITGTIKAEQFDMGSNGVGYSNVMSHPTNWYRPTKLGITNCNDLGGGYCLDQVAAGEWAQYTINVLVPQTYMVEVRAEAIGTNTGGVFQCDFTNGIGVVTNGAGISNSTGPLTITTNTWTNFTIVVYLPTNATVMKLHCLNNATNSSYVGRFNYISIYPWWQAGFTSTNTNYVSGLSTGTNYSDALSNAAAIQHEIDTLPTNGGTVSITNGTYYVAQASPNEAEDAWANAAVSITNSNIEIAGAGESNTTLIAYNRATTVFSLGRTVSSLGRLLPAQCTNFVLRDMTIEGRPHWAVTNNVITTNIIGSGTNIYAIIGTGMQGTNVTWDTNQFGENSVYEFNTNIWDTFYTGTHAIFYGLDNSHYSHNILITNCQFLYGYDPVALYGPVSNVMVRACTFNIWGGGYTNFGNVGIWAAAYNVVVIENAFNGNSNLAPASFQDVSTNMYYNSWIAPSGLAWLQIGGNFFVARNVISNYLLEGVQVNEGPSSVVGNTYNTLVNNASCCALCAVGGGGNGPSGTAQDYSIYFIGNSVYGGRCGVKASGGTFSDDLCNCTANTFTLYPAYNEYHQPPGAAAGLPVCRLAAACGNTELAGGYGFLFLAGPSGSALILNNNFAGATYRGIGDGGPPDSLTSAQVFGNIIAQGATFHVEMPYTNSFGWFLGHNRYLDAFSNSVPPFLDPPNASVHFCN